MQVVRVNMRQNQEHLKELAVNSDWREDHQEEMISMRDLAKQRPNVVVSCCHLLSTLVTLKKLCKHWSAAFILRNPDGVFLMARHDRKGPINKVPNRKDVSRWQGSPWVHRIILILGYLFETYFQKFNFSLARYVVEMFNFQSFPAMVSRGKDKLETCWNRTFSRFRIKRKRRRVSKGQKLTEFRHMENFPKIRTQTRRNK